MNSTSRPRSGYAGIGVILEEMAEYLPSEKYTQPQYRRCRTIFGMLTRLHSQAEDSSSPEKEYKELQRTEQDLRRALHALNNTKGVPAQMTKCLDELKDAIQDGLDQGVSADYMMRGMKEIIEEIENLELREVKPKVKMVPETKVLKLRTELKDAKKKIEQLNKENNELALKLKRTEMERDRFLR